MYAWVRPGNGRRKMAPSQLARFLTLLLIPLRPVPLLTLLLLAAVLAISVWAGPFGLPLVLILLGWTFKYSFVFLDRLVAGDREAPVLAVEMIVTSMGEARSLLPLIITAFAFFATGAGAFLVGAILSAVAAVILLAILPAVLAVQGWTGRLAHSVSPSTLRTMIRVLGSDYLWVAGCTLAVGLVCVVIPAVAGGMPLFVRIALLLYAWLAIVAVTGGAVHAKRAVLHQEIPLTVAELRDVSPEELQRLREIWLDGIYGAWRSGAEASAWHLVSEGMDQSRDSLDDLRWLYGRLAHWQPTRFSNRVAAELLARLSGAQREGEALRLVKERLAIDPGFRPDAGPST